MGALAAAVSKTGENIVPKVAVMIKELIHRGDEYHGIATPNSVLLSKAIDEIRIDNLDSNVSLGHNLSCTLLRDHPQPIQCKDFSLIFEGRLFPFSGVSEYDEVKEKLKFNPNKNARHVIEELRGSYVFAIACPNRIISGRDTLGTNPLYYGTNETTCAIASERKALWTLGIKNAKSFPPGNLAVISTCGFSFTPIKKLTQPPIRSIKMENAAKHLQELLWKSTKERVADLKKVAVAFSGGLDSSVIAVLTKICGVNVHLISVGLEGQNEVEHAKAAAEALQLPLHAQTYNSEDVERVLPKVLWLIEEPNVMKASIAVPFFWAAATASKLGYNVLLAGQGSDELFGGYQRYLRKYAQHGSSVVQETMYNDTALSYERNFQRDNQICSFHKVELRLPFADFKVANFSLSLPVKLNIESTQDNLRKRVLRLVAQKLGMPLFIVNRVKKAIQYGTGVDRVIRKLARKKDLTPQKYIKKVFNEVYGAKE